MILVMKRLADAHIEMNCQIVLCPGINDGKELDRTIKELAQLYPYVNSVAIVPVGITKHRENLVELNIFNDKSASKTIEQIHQIQQKYLEKLGTLQSLFLTYVSYLHHLQTVKNLHILHNHTIHY